MNYLLYSILVCQKRKWISSEFAKQARPISLRSATALHTHSVSTHTVWLFPEVPPFRRILKGLNAKVTGVFSPGGGLNVYSRYVASSFEKGCTVYLAYYPSPPFPSYIRSQDLNCLIIVRLYLLFRKRRVFLSRKRLFCCKIHSYK